MSRSSRSRPRSKHITGTTVSAQQNTEPTVYTAQRRWVRHRQPVWPFFWRGLLPVVGLLAVLAYGLTGFASEDVELVVKRELRQNLDAEGLPWVSMEVSGQQVRLGGTPPHDGGGDSALALARAATCPSWVGRRVCAVEVSGHFAQPTAAAATLPPAPPAPIAAAAPAAAVKACEDRLAAIVQKSLIEFDNGRATLRAGSKAVIAELAQAAKGCPGLLRVEGHTDNVGNEAANLGLSRARADAVRAALVQAGVPAARLVAEGLGPKQPLADNTSAEGRARNRRIEFRVAGL